MTQAKSQRGVLNNYTYNTNGNPTQYVIQNSSGTEKLQSTTEYTANGAFVSRVTDQHGYATTYDYNQNTGVLNSTTDVLGNKISNTYDPVNDRLLSVSQTLKDGSKAENTYTYSKDRISGIIHNGFTYGFEYDSFGNTTKTKVGSQALSTNTYGAHNGELQKVTYGNGATIEYTYDQYGNTIATSQNGVQRFTWGYNSSGYANSHQDAVTQLQFDYNYDSTGRLIRQHVRDLSLNANGDRELYKSEYQYDQNNNISKFVNQAGGRTMVESFTYGSDNLPEKYTMPSGISKTYKYGSINRPYQTQISTKTPIQLETLYHTSKRNAAGQSQYRTMQIYQESIGNLKYYYTYDKLGNIIQINKSENGTETVIATYAYDELNQLVRENSLYTGLSKVYTYDNGGNILRETQYPLSFNTLGTATKTIEYGYGDANWKDKMTSYNGQAVSYDEIGNPLTYRGYAMSWNNGRELANIQGFGVDAQYQYDADGLRTRKTVNGVKTEYYYVGSQLTYEKRGDGTELYYFYDGEGKLSGLRYVKNGTSTDYVAVVNSRGDVDSLYDINGALVARYQYDGWGNTAGINNAAGEPIADKNHIAYVNPIRYRGYYQDAETGMYYLQSRYYDAQTHRMLNEDVLVGGNEELQSYNLFLYCGNNPVNRLDDTGYLWKWVEKSINTVKKTYNKCKTWVKGLVRDVGHGAVDATISKTVNKKLPSEASKTSYVKFDYERGKGCRIKTWGATTKAGKVANTAKGTARGVSKVGVLAVAMLGVDIYQDTKTFEGGKLAAAIALDVGALALSLFAGALISAAMPVAAPAIAVFALTTVSGYAISVGANKLKDQLE